MSLLRKLFSSKKESRTDRTCETEKCIYCGANTTVPVSAPIESRPNYVSGCGQLCPECYAKLCDAVLDDEGERLMTAAIKRSEEHAQ